MTCFALLDDATGAGTSRLYTGFRREHLCRDAAALEDCWAAVERDAAVGLQAVVIADYDFGRALQGLPSRHAGARADTDGALRVLMFERLQQLDERATEAWLCERAGTPAPGVAGLGALQPEIDRPAYDTAIADILELIRAGETYQVNHTHRLQAPAFGEPIELYRRLRARQPVAFGALIALPAEGDRAGRWIVSLSPELFLRHKAGALEARPMKGTAPRGADAAEDARLAAWLAADQKNRAENLMIVDLLRNDLGRISDTGSVKVPRLFEIETYRSVLQMTSTVTAALRRDVGFAEVMRSTFPCGSITGAPKRHTMALVDRLEASPRGLYTGAIGWADAPAGGRACGDFCLSVAIRTLVLDEVPGQAARRATLGVGGGIVLDSVAADEHAETQVKLRFLTGLDPGFTLFETLRAVGPRVPALARHLMRLQASAAALGFRCDAEALRAAVLDEVAGAPEGRLHRLRLDLSHDGSWRLSGGPVERIRGPVKLLLSAARLTRTELALAGHKTSCRATYDAALCEAMDQGAFDTLFFDDRGLLTEGARSNVFLRLDGRWWTPPLTGAVLPGVMRARLLARPGFAERPLHDSDLARAEDLVVCNALRGVLRGRVSPAAEAPTAATAAKVTAAAGPGAAAA